MSAPNATDRINPFRRSGLGKRGLPFAIAMVLPFPLLPVGGTSHLKEELVVVAAALSVAIVLAVITVPWERLPQWTTILPPLAYLVVIASLRDSQGGATSGFAPLLLLPLLWVALYGDLRQVIVMIVAATLTLVLPIVLIGEPSYPVREFRRATLQSLAIGFGTVVTNQLVGQVRQRSREAAAALAEARASREFLSAVMNSASEGITTIDDTGKTLFINPAAQRMFGYDADELLGQAEHDLVHHTRPDGRPYPREECPIAHTVADREPRTVGDEVFWRKDGTSFPVIYGAVPVTFPDGGSGVVVSFTDITERREVERLKDEFVSVVGHELRTPLTSIRGSLGLVSGGVLGELEPEAKRMVDIAVTNSDRLVRLINDILDIERIESGRVEMSRRLTNAEELMAQAAQTMVGLAGDQHVELLVEPVDEALWADPDRILQTLMNLLSNAIKFSPEGGTVVLGATRVNGEVRFEVRDEGRGIPPDKLDSVFERFGQVDASDSRDKGGTGLGLPIARSIVEHHGGRMWVESEVGKGTTFHFTLPTVTATTSDEDTGDPLALVVEDDADLAKVLAAALTAEGLHAWTAPGASEAVRLLSKRRPDAIVLDLVLPDGDGAELVAWMRTQPGLADVPLAVFTVKDLEEAERERLRLGPTHHFVKGATTPEEVAAQIAERARTTA
jgi:PAS domain S-box-containing protein